MQSFNMQKQQLQANILEFESALEELDNTDASYKIIGNIMVKVDQDKLKKSLEEDKKNAEIRIKAVEKQEDSMKEKAKRIQQEVMEEMKNNG